MFSSNQILDITCNFEDLYCLLKSVLHIYGDEIFTRKDGSVKLSFCDSVPGMYLVGTGSMKPYEHGPNKGFSVVTGKGWNDFLFDYDLEKLTDAVIEWAQQQKVQEHPFTDGSREKYVRIRSLQSMNYDDQKKIFDSCDPFDMIVAISVFEHVYHK